jgi:hypothetical protein
MSNYTYFPGGIVSQGVPVFSGGQHRPIMGNVFFVDSGHAKAADDPYGGDKDAPFLTLDYAISQCTSNNGDRIYVLDGHSETVANTTAFNVDKAGIEIIGLGRGSLKPTFSLETLSAATVTVGSANTLIENIRINANVTGGSLVGLTVATGADGSVFNNVDMYDTTSGKEFVKGISIAADADDLVFTNCRYYGKAGGSTTHAFYAAGGTDRLIFANNFIDVDASSSAICMAAAPSVQIQFLNNRIHQRDTASAVSVSFHAASGTGIAAGNFVYTAVDTIAPFTGSAMTYFENYGTNAAAASGIILPAVDS